MGFGRLVLAEVHELGGTISARITLAISLPVLVTLLYLYAANAKTSEILSAYKQVEPLIYVSQIGQLLLLVSIIMLVSGKWQYKSAQPSLLKQPDRLRYLAAQATVMAGIWFLTMALTFGLFFWFRQLGAQQADVGYLLAIRPGWLLLVTVMATMMVMVSALIIAMLIPHSTAALVVYFVVVPSLMGLREAAPAVLGMINPLEMALFVAGDRSASALTAWGSLVVWASLFAFAVYMVRHRDAG
ncbi:hypothetical protein D5S17_35985 [Pseudonocardiaceae bacterium YIM PH 21723]|nr:hypothetical protein D5S17_35985 [Pseudonocardiaceae bacterium YIM PH 21723]